MSVTVYSTTTCPWCVKAKEHLDELKVSYAAINISEDSEARKRIFEKTRQMGVPVIEIGDRFIVGYDPEAIDRTLRDAQIID